jgi:mannose/cellobiose epimerase-like protein (N-acyl-D-glucosamine 2-epimerase family)
MPAPNTRERHNWLTRYCRGSFIASILTLQQHGQLEGQSMDIGFTPDQSRVARKFVSYTFMDMARLCATRGWEEAHGRSVERLMADLTPAPIGYRRGMVAGRQLFFFSHAYRLTMDPIYEDRARHLYADLLNHFWDKTNGGWYFSVDDDNAARDTTKDLYGHAFIMFGLAHYAAIFSDTDAFNWQLQTNELVHRHFRLPGGWFAPSTTRDWVILGRNLEQNPHMHLLEAYLSAYGATQDEALLKCGTEIISIYTEMLRTRDGTKVLEHFDENGQPAAGGGNLIEPGHLYEWYWLLNEYADIAGLPAYRATCAPIIDWADRWGGDSDSGGIYDLVDSDGNVVSSRKRIWPVTECIKALATLVRISGSEQSKGSLAQWIKFIQERYCTKDGAWHEYLNRNLRPDCDYLALSTPYHVAMAALEVERLLGGQGAFGMRNSKARGFSLAHDHAGAPSIT